MNLGYHTKKLLNNFWLLRLLLILRIIYILGFKRHMEKNKKLLIAQIFHGTDTLE